MLFHKSGDETRRLLFPARLGAALFLLFLTAVAGWSWLGGTERSEAAGLEAAALPSPAEPTAAEAAAEEEAAQRAAAYFAAYRLEREENRAAELSRLDSIIADPLSSKGAVEAAEQRRFVLSSASGQELQAESLLEAKGFGETVVILGENIATVIVDVAMDDKLASQIAEAVDSVSNCGFENVVVVNR